MRVSAPGITILRNASNPGIQVVPVEGSSQACQEISTSDDINSCGYDNETQQVVCTSNDTNVYVISGTKITRTRLIQAPIC